MTPQAPPAATGPHILAAIAEVKAELDAQRQLLVARQDIFRLATTAIEWMLQIEEAFKAIVGQMEEMMRFGRQQHQIADERARRIDRYVVDDAFNLDATNKQLIESFNAMRAEVLDMKALLKREHDATRKALVVQLETAEIGAPPRRA